jgi:hypothetical protein
LSVDSATQVTLSVNATGSSTTALVFAPYGVGDGSTTFGLPNRAYRAVGRDNASGSASNINQVSTTFSITTGTKAATVASATGLYVGMFASAPKLPLGTKITAISGTSVTVSNNATGTVVTGAIRFSSILDAQTLGAVGGAISTSTTLVTANLPAYTPSGTNGAVTITGNNALGIVVGTGTSPIQSGSGVSIYTPGSFQALAPQLTAPAQSFAGSAQGGTSKAIVSPTLSPTIVMNYIIKQ